MTRLEQYDKAPEFSTIDLNGASFTLAEVCQTGPVLLVFNRGFV